MKNNISYNKEVSTSFLKGKHKRKEDKLQQGRGTKLRLTKSWRHQIK